MDSVKSTIVYYEGTSLCGGGGTLIVGGGLFPGGGGAPNIGGGYFLEEELACAVEEAPSLRLLSLTEEALA